MSESVTYSVEERLRSALVMCNTLKHCALLADEAVFVGLSVFTPDETLKLFPAALDALVGQLSAIMAALTVERLNLPAPDDDSPAPIRLRDAVLAIAGVSEDTRAIELAEDTAQRMVALKGATSLIWLNAEDDDGDPVPHAVEALAERIETVLDNQDYRRAREVLADVSALTPEQVSDLQLEVQTCETRAAYYLGLARGWLAALRLQGGAR